MTARSEQDKHFEPFVQRVRESLAGDLCDSHWDQLLDGAAAAEVRQLVPRALRTEDGIFFSGHAVANAAVSLVAERLRDGANVFDPSCGAGDLLLGAARAFPLRDTLRSTLTDWGRRLGGVDLHQSFIDAAKLRLVLLACKRHRTSLKSLAPADAAALFPNIVKADYLGDADIGRDYDCILTNPPFGHRKAPQDCAWSSGKTQLAAIFMDQVLGRGKTGQTVAAILPDVLRGGTRYSKWREAMARHARATASQVFGRFEPQTDVDVFLIRYDLLQPGLMALKPHAVEAANQHICSDARILGDLFAVSVGAVVPHRHKGDVGPWKPYLTVVNAPVDGTTAVQSTRRFGGTCHSAPFVAIRRTSNPSDKRRLAATVVTAPTSIAVENHLIVAAPKSGSIEDCERLATYLRSTVAREWIDSRLRCRHLTTGALIAMPLPTNW